MEYNVKKIDDKRESTIVLGLLLIGLGYLGYESITNKYFNETPKIHISSSRLEKKIVKPLEYDSEIDKRITRLTELLNKQPFRYNKDNKTKVYSLKQTTLLGATEDCTAEINQNNLRIIADFSFYIKSPVYTQPFEKYPNVTMKVIVNEVNFDLAKKTYITEHELPTNSEHNNCLQKNAISDGLYRILKHYGLEKK